MIASSVADVPLMFRKEMLSMLTAEVYILREDTIMKEKLINLEQSICMLPDSSLCLGETRIF